MDDEQITEDREEVAEDTTPETNEEAVEQRTDDYDGLARRIDDLTDLVRSRFDAITSMLETLGVAAVESDNVTDGEVYDLADEAADVVDEILGIDSLDLL